MSGKSCIQGLGNDIVEVDRIRKSIEHHGSHFLNRLFTQREQEYCTQFKDSSPHFAGRFAAKEAIAKALGVGFGAMLAWHDLEILNDDKGKPSVFFSEKGKKQWNNPQFFLSISHETNYAIAVAVWLH